MLKHVFLHVTNLVHSDDQFKILNKTVIFYSTY